MRQEAEGFIGFLRERADRADELAGTPLPVSMTKDAFWATPDETDELLKAVNDLLAPYVQRVQHHADRPAGARLMRWFATSHPDLTFPPAPGPEASDAPDAATEPPVCLAHCVAVASPTSSRNSRSASRSGWASARMRSGSLGLWRVSPVSVVLMVRE